MTGTKKRARDLYSDQPSDGMAFECITATDVACSCCGTKSVGILVGEYGPHYAKRICVGCSRFRGWEPRPDAGGGAPQH